MKPLFILSVCILFLLSNCENHTSLQIEGTVVSQKTGEVVHRATVELGIIGWTSSDYQLLDKTRTDENGHYRLEYSGDEECNSLLNIGAWKTYNETTRLSGTFPLLGEEILCIDDLQIIDLELVCIGSHVGDCPE